MNEANIAKEKAKTLSDDLRVERQLILCQIYSTILYSHSLILNPNGS